MLVLFSPGSEIVPTVRPVIIILVHTVDIYSALSVLGLGIDTPCTLDYIISGIRSGQGTVVSEFDCFPAGAFYYRCNNVTAFKVRSVQIVILALVVLYPLVKTAGFTCNGIDRKKTVAPVYSQGFCNGSQLMSGIEFAVTIYEIKQSSVYIFSAESNFITQIVTVTALHVNDFSEDTLTNHIENRHFVSTITAVFKKHTDFSGFFTCSDHLPTFFNRGGSADFGSNVATRFHCVNRNSCMGNPGCSNNNRIKFFFGKHFFIINIGVNGIFPVVCLFNNFNTFFRPLGNKITNGGNSDSIHL